MTKTVKTARVAIYSRVSTDAQTTENQERELRENAEQDGRGLVENYRVAGIGGSTDRDQRLAFEDLCKDATRRRCDLIMAWSVDRLGRSLPDLVSFLTEIHGAGVDLFLLKQGLDTRTPAGKAMFQMMGVFAEFERAMIVERINAGLATARAKGVKLGRRPIDAKKEQAITAALRAGDKGIKRIAKDLGVGVGTVQRVKAQGHAN
jgi:DNA invertase Pin-like site-specific DNA recombinase